MRTTRDAVRSMARYMSEVFGDDWEIGFFNQEATFTRPGVEVKPGTSQDGGGTRHSSDVVLPIMLYAYPEPGDSVSAGFDNALAVEETFWQAFRVGVGEGRPMRVPLYDYEGISINEGTLLRRYPDYLRIADLSITRSQAPTNESLWTVTCETRVGWRRSGELEAGTRLARALKVDLLTP